MSSDISLFTKGLGVACVALSLSAFGATHYVSPDGNHTAPFLTWETAATNIQSAIASSVVGDIVLVTNGVYATGGAKGGTENQTNRVALNSAIIVRSLNGPNVTIIEGAWTPGTTNGAQSIRCAYLASGATLDGFTLRNGSTITTPGGGGAYCYSQSATITNCIIKGNATVGNGGGVYGGTVRNSLIEGNTSGYRGGGASGSSLWGCLVRSNVAVIGGGAEGPVGSSAVGCAFVRNVANIGGGVAGGNARNCTITQNTATSRGGGVDVVNVTNCIVYYNSSSSVSPNYSGSLFRSSCTTPLPPGLGNISQDPRLLPDLIHLRPDSPCLGKGNAVGLTGADIDGSPWNSPPSMGCDEWTPALATASTSIQAIPASTPRDVTLSFSFAGETPTCEWFKDGVLLANGQKYSAAESGDLLVRDFAPTDAGAYQLVATNSYGAITTAVMQVNVACVDLQSAAPTAPYDSWQTAATNLQEAIDSAQGTTVILVTNGVYDTGAKDISGLGQTRIVLNGAVTVMGVNGPGQTIIQGAWDPASTNGSASVRCVVMGPDSFLSGFTLRNGSTTTQGAGVKGLLPASQAQVYGCVITNCSAKLEGGGAYGVGVADCTFSNNKSASNGGGMSTGAAWRSSFIGNSSVNGAGAYNSLLKSCQVVGNFGSGVYGGEITKSMIATNSGAGAVVGRVENCRIIGNQGSGVVNGFVFGSLIKGNLSFGSEGSTNLNCTFVANAAADSTGLFGTLSVNCVYSFNKSLGDDWTKLYSIDEPGGRNPPVLRSNLMLLPNLLSDLEHIAANSPCIGRGTNHGLVPFDIDGQPFKNPPAMGCDEWYPDIIIAAQPRVIPGDLPGEAVVFFDLVGDPAQCWWSKDGAPVQAGEHYASVPSNSLRIRNFGPLDIGDYQVVASNSFGVVTSAVVHVKVACVDPTSLNATAPFDTWQTAATTIQEAVDLADAQTVIVVTNGVYATGSRAVGSDTPNRLVVSKPVVVISANGADNTIIEGAWDPVSTNGPASVRCAWLSSEAMLAGFTFRNGSSPTNGGGVWIDSAGSTANLSYCVITNCTSQRLGGGIYQGRVQNSLIAGNLSDQDGGGTFGANLDNCVVRLNKARFGGGVAHGIARGCRISENVASRYGGGTSGAHLVSCSIAFNVAPANAGVHGAGQFMSGGAVPTTTVFQCTIVSNAASSTVVAGAYSVWLYNSIAYHNTGVDDPISGKTFENLGKVSQAFYVCSPLTTNTPKGYVLNALPQLIDPAHLAATSPCIGAGAPLGNLGFDDIDGEPWAAKPSMGCDEFYSSGLVGPLGVTVVGWPKVAAGGSMPLAALIDGKATGVQWDFGDGIITNQVGYNPSHAWSAPGNYTVTATVYNTDHAQGVSASLPIEVIPFTIPALGQPEISGTNFQMSFSSQPGLTYEVYIATNLVAPIDWKLLKRLYSTGDSMSITDTNAPAPAKFYRLELK